jgi:hypothetical protein
MPVTCEFDLSGLQAAVMRFGYLVDRSLGPAVIGAAEDGIGQVKASHRYKDRTGKLTGTAKATLRRTGQGGAMAEMHWPATYARVVDEGSRAHIIEAKSRKYLRFVAASGGACFARRVRHPGTKGYGFAGDAYLKAERSLETRLVVAIHDAARECLS